ncbi:MAG: GGDEF domain-containing protein [Desulfovibrionaceae bacterium]
MPDHKNTGGAPPPFAGETAGAEQDVVLEELAEELLSLQGRFRQCLQSRGENDNQEMALLRLCPGIGLEDWRRLSERLSLEHWVSLPLAADAYPHLLRLQQTLEKLSYESEHDPLTGLANRRAFDRALDMELERSRRHKTPLALAVIDLDDFKSINDTYGHAVGDEVLVRMAQLMHDHKRRYDTAARLGGEEFGLLLSGVGAVKAGKILNRLIASLRQVEFAPQEGRPFKVTASVGLACCMGRMEIDAATLMGLADKSLYQAKAEGKNQVITAPIPDLERVPDQTLVHADEKRFLFSG